MPVPPTFSYMGTFGTTVGIGETCVEELVGTSNDEVAVLKA